MRLLLSLGFALSMIVSAYGAQFTGPTDPSPDAYRVFLPSVYQRNNLGEDRVGKIPGSYIRRVNVPYFPNTFSLPETAVFWFGKVTPTENYADVRMGYSDNELFIRVAAFDQKLWYDSNPSPESLHAWDSVSLYLDLDGNQGDGLPTRSYRFDGMLNWWEDRANFQAAYRGGPDGWTKADISFETKTGWRGNAPQDDKPDRGWTITYHVPFQSLGLAQAPQPGEIWGLGVVLHDRDSANESPLADKFWPETMLENDPDTWGQLAFGLPTYIPPAASTGGSITIRDRLDGATVTDGMVGGGTTCGAGIDFWTEWGDKAYPGEEFINVQNQEDVADWPCYSKFYLRFPLNNVPQGKVILSAKLVLHQFGNSGGGEWGAPPRSLIQAFTVAEDWDPAKLTWNSAPLALENVSRTWVDGITDFPGWPGIPYEWEVSKAAAQAYATGQPLRLALYSADAAYHTGKYFVSSVTEDWNKTARPTLVIEWGNPQ
jgi:hypothetical protein